MAASSSSSSSYSTSHLLLLVGSCLLLVSYFAVSEAYTTPHLVKGLSWSFYKNSCPKVESVIRRHLKKVFKKDIGNAAGLLRLHFHDCFVQVQSLYSSIFGLVFGLFTPCPSAPFLLHCSLYHTPFGFFYWSSCSFFKLFKILRETRITHSDGGSIMNYLVMSPMAHSPIFS